MHNIVIDKWSRKAHLNVCDDGSLCVVQEEYYVTHQCFLTNRGLYLLVWNVKDGIPGIESLNIWLQNLQVRPCAVYMYIYMQYALVFDLFYGGVCICVFSIHTFAHEEGSFILHACTRGKVHDWFCPSVTCVAIA